jgi:hypothetical protein
MRPALAARQGGLYCGGSAHMVEKALGEAAGGAPGMHRGAGVGGCADVQRSPLRWLAGLAGWLANSAAAARACCWKRVVLLPSSAGAAAAAGLPSDPALEGRRSAGSGRALRAPCAADCGCAAAAASPTAGVEGDDILYVGDHIYTDAALAKINFRWVGLEAGRLAGAAALVAAWCPPLPTSRGPWICAAALRGASAGGCC